MRLWLVPVLSLLVAAPAYADTSACWGMANDPSHPELSCTALTGPLLSSLEGATRTQVVSSMGAPGLPDVGGVLRFESNYAFRRRGYSGAVAFTFDQAGRVAVIEAAVDAPHHKYGMKFVWNATVPGCSDFPDSIQRCDNIEGAPRPLEKASAPKGTTSWHWVPAWLRRRLFSSG
jgi:hypothetical protein